MTKSRTSLTTLAVFLCLCLPWTGGQAQQRPVLWQQVEPDGAWPALPATVKSAHAILLDPAVLSALAPGDHFTVRLGAPGQVAEILSARVTGETFYINGDRMLSAGVSGVGMQHPLVMTIGSNTVLAHLDGEDSSWQLLAEPVTASGFQEGSEASLWRGWLYQTESPALDWEHDFVIPAAPQAVRKTQPLDLDGQDASSTPESYPARTAGINSSNFRVEQNLSQTAVVAGDSITVELEVQNISQGSHQDLVLDLYFALDNTTLLDVSPACSQLTTNQGQKILSCRLGDFAPGASKRFSYTVQTSSASMPWVASTAIIGDLRNDAWVNVVTDVLADSDGDGISNFNEQLLNTDPQSASSVDRSLTTIDVMALYTPEARNSFGAQTETRINQQISVANQIYRDSGVNIVLRPVYHGQVPYSTGESMDAMLDTMTRRSHPAFSSLDSLRSRFGADLVVLFRPQGNEPDRCGVANLGGQNTRGDFLSTDDRDYAYSVVAIDCPVSSALAHELGHSMGLTHSRREDGSGGTLPWATGYGVDSRFSTVMAFPGKFNTDVRLPRFSSPALDCLGQPCGVDRNDAEQGADAVHVLNLVRHQIAAYFPPRLPDPTRRNTVRASGGATDARIASIASIDEGLSFVQTVYPGQTLDIAATLMIDSADVGKKGQLHVLIGQGNGSFLQLTDTSELIPWDGRLSGLLPFRQPEILAPVEYLTAVKGLPVDKSFTGERLSIFIAYQVEGSGDVVYTAEPLRLNIDPAP